MSERGTDPGQGGIAATGAIHDLGYKRYVGTRRPASTRWRAIMRQQIAHGWAKWWRYKMSLGGAVITACIAGGLLFFMTSRVVRRVGAAAGDLALTFADAAVPMSFEWFMRMAFVLSLTLGASIVATDTQSGAFTFYYVRSVRPRDYVLGKLAGYGVLVATLVLAGPLLLACFRLGLSDDVDQLVDHLGILPRTLAIALLATAAYTAIPLAISALVPNRRHALALWVAHYLIVGTIAAALGGSSGSALSAIDLQTAFKAITYELFDLTILRGPALRLDATTAALVVAGQIALAVGLLGYQVSRDQRHGVGGSS